MPPAVTQTFIGKGNDNMKLYPHQEKSLKELSDKNRIALYWDMGLGKTYGGSEKMIQLGAKINLIICQKSKVKDWIDHFDKHYYIDFLIFDLTNKTDLEAFMSYQKQEEPFARIGVINYDLIFRRKELLQLKDFTLILDESSLIQNPTAKRTKFIMGMNPKNIILLSGTPTGGKYEKLITQIHLLGWNISEDLFWNQYVDWEWNETDDGFWQKKVNGYKNVDRLKRKLREHGCDFLKTEEVIDLPEQINQTIYIDPIKEYKKFHEGGYTEINGEEIIGDNILTKMLRERQLCGQYNQDKLDAFQDLLRETEDRIVVFYNFTDELNKLMNLADGVDKPISIVNGQEKSLECYEEYNNSVTFIQYQAGAMGLNLQKANKIIYFTPPLSSELFEQSKKRIHRIGQNKPCFYYYLTCKDSIERKIYLTLEMRRDYTEELFKEEKYNDNKRI